MGLDDVIKDLRRTIVDLQSQLDDLKQDKRDLRFDKESLKQEVGSIKEELKAARERVVGLRKELLEARSESDDWKGQLEELTRKTQELPQETLPRPSAPTQADRETSPIIVDSENSVPIPSATGLSVAQSLATQCPAPEYSSCRPPSNETGPVAGPSIMPNETPGPTSQTANIAVNIAATEGPTTRSRKRKGAVGGKASGEGPPQKRIATVKIPVMRPPSNMNVATVPETNVSTTLSIRGRPAIQYNEDAAFVLPPQVLASYLELAPPLHISPTPSALHVSRKFLADIYGGSSRVEAQHIIAFDNPSGGNHRAFTFPPFELNPGMPLVPGYGGVIIAPRFDRKTGTPWGLFRRDIMGNTDTWLYMGEYEWTAVGQMSAEVFRGQTRKAKESWADELLKWKRNISDYYASMRARIALRKAGLLPVQDNSEFILVKQELSRIRAQVGHPIDRDDIIAAFERGDEMVDIDLLRCVSYDRTLALDIEAKFRQPPPRVKRKTKKRYNYPSRFITSSGMMNGLGVKGKHPAAKVQPAAPVENASGTPPATSQVTASGVQPIASNAPEETVSPVAQDPEEAVMSDGSPVLQQGISGVYDTMFGEDDSDEDLTSLLDEDLDELAYP
ncbi:hypothetical protein NMY22_g7235 [Coprinellus aureogranulatus]|nr:hypothetical protein NMY22_g7235 [Coprinellus aureogranulatus]